MNKLFATFFVALCLVASATAVTVVSDTSVTTYDPLNHYAVIGSADWVNPVPATLTWVHPSWPFITGASWISTSYNVEDPSVDSWRKFSTSFEVPECGEDETLVGDLIKVTSDNAEEVYLNGNLIGNDGTISGAFTDHYEWNTILNYPLTDLQPGTNTLQFIVRNYAQDGGSAESNPTGLIFRTDLRCQGPGNDVPEFGVIAAGIAMIGALSMIIFMRR